MFTDAYPQPYPELETERLRLRYWHNDDYEAYARLCADAEVMEFLGGQPFSRQESWRHMATMMGHWLMRGYGHWAVEEKSSGQFIGRLGFLMPEDWPGFEVGWTLAREHWGKGFAPEGARAALDYVFNNTDQDAVVSIIDPGNKASIAVAKKLGMEYSHFENFKNTPVSIYKLLKPGYLASI